LFLLEDSLILGSQ